MDFGRTQITGLLNGTVHDKAKFTGLLYRLDTLLSIYNGHKLILNRLDKVLLTSSAAEIYESVSYKHPIVKILGEYLAKAEPCVGGTEYFISTVKSLIAEVHFLLENGIKPKKISDTFRDLALLKKAEQAEIDGDQEEGVSPAVRELIRATLKDDHLSALLIECMAATGSCDPEKIRLCKVPAGCFEDSYRLDGMIINRKPEGSVQRLVDTTVGIFNCPLDINRTELKGTVLLRDHKELINFSKDEVAGIKELVDRFNVNAMVVCGKIDSLFLELLNRRNILVLKVFSKFDLKRICDAVGGGISNGLVPVTQKGRVAEISAFRDAGFDFTRIVGSANVSTLVLKNSVRELLEEKERVIFGLLESLKTRAMQDPSDSRLADASFHTRMIKMIGNDDAIRERICKALAGKDEGKMFEADKARCLGYAFEFLGLLLEVDDYLVAKRDALDIKPPQHNGHWDEDH
ncbi:T-complex protein 1 subunit theta [Pancytospora philotis]|nr:T-complex protein 1 subunit theta [Pancytospora philotis]